MQTLRYSWLGIAALTLVLFSNLTLAIEKPTNTTGDYAVFYSSYLKFLDKELNAAYKTLRTKLPEDKQKQLKASQVSWIKYRDLEFTFIDSTWTNKDFGTSSGISRGQYKASVVRDRVIQLMHYAKTF